MCRCKGAFVPRIALRQGEKARKRGKKGKEGKEKEKTWDGFQGTTKAMR